MLGCPPPYRGNNTRVAGLLREMRALGYVVHFAGVGLSEEEKAGTLPWVDQWVANFVQPPPAPLSLWGLLKRKTRSLFYRLHWVEDKLDGLFYAPWLDEARELQQRFHYPRVLISYVHHSKFLQAFPDSCLKLIDTHDVFTNRRHRLRAAGVATYWRSYSAKDERRGLQRAQHIIAIQEQEAAYLRRLTGSACRVFTVGHFAKLLEQPLPPARILRLGCIGSRNGANVHGWQWFVRDVWPLVQKRVAGVEIWVAGTLCEKCTPAPGVRLLGQVPSLADFYRDCPVFINPVRTGTGLKIKTIESLMHGRPVVTTRVGAEGVESFLGHGLFICDSAEEFANSIVNLLSDLPLAQRLGEESLLRARSYVLENRQVLAEALAK